MAIKVNQELVNKLKNDVINRELKIDFQRTEILLDIYKEYEGYPAIIIRARFFERLLQEKKIYIDENLFVGSMASEFGAFYLYPEWNTEWLKKEKKFEIPKEYEGHLKEIFAYWDKRSVPVRSEQKYEDLFGEDFNVLVQTGFVRNGCTNPAGVSNSNTEKVLEKGLEQVIREVSEKRKNLELTAENRAKFDFYEAVIIVLNALIQYAGRYASLARELAEKTDDAAKREHYLEIAKVCEQVPAKPARNFREAIQSHFFLHLGQEIEQVGCGYSNGFLGQVLEPYYQKDKSAGVLDAEQATYLLKHFFLKLNDISYYYGEAYDIANSGDTAQTISVGGYNAKGQDATGEVDSLVIDAQYDLRLPQPPLAVIYHDKLKPQFVQKCLDLVKTGIGMPQFMNADVLVERSLEAYARYGATIEDARRSCVYGCVSTAIANKTSYLMGDSINITKAFELALYNGVDPLSGERIGVETGDPESFDNFEQFFEAFEKQLDVGVKAARRHSRIDTLLYNEFLQLPFRSALTDGCIESGKDVWSDGSEFVATATVYGGGIDAANSLLAVKHLIYDEKKLTFGQLKEALDADFEGYDLIRKLCEKAPKYGNNVADDDAIVQRVYDVAYDSFLKAGKNYFGKEVKPDAYSKSFHNYFGLKTGALPTGRKARKALTDGSVSAMPGSDVNGPSALLASAAKVMDSVKYNSVHLNVKLNPVQLKSPEGNEALLSLIDGFMNQGGNHIQFNCVDANTLRDAKVHPENHRDLVVRVAGFSAFFTKLHVGIQDEIIARTEHSFSA